MHFTENMVKMDLSQSILESLKIPYTHSGVFSSGLAMDKELSRLIFKKNKIKVPKYFLLHKGL